MKNITIMFLACAVLLSGCAHKNYEYSLGNSSSADFSVTESVGAGASYGLLGVYVCGAVLNPGVYELLEGSRICDAIILAGGFDTGADETSVNQAQYIKDGMQIRVLYKGELISGGGKVNINLADKNTLMSLPGIGETKADAIISYRQEHGGFSDANELKNVNGIGEGLFSEIIDLIEL